MKKLLSICAAVLALAGVARADTNGTSTTSVTTASTKVLSANDVVGGRHYLFFQNLGSVTVNCTIGVSAGATTTTGISLIAGNAYLAPAIQGPTGVFAGPPNGEIDCIAASSTAPVTVISY
jgi:hypothetical protein